MDGVLAWPHGVGRLTAEYDVDGRRATTSSWLLVSSLTPANAETCRTIIAGWYLTCANDLSLLMSRAAELTACSVTISSLEYATARVQVEPVPGAWTGAQALSVASGLHFIGGRRGRGTQSVMRIPSMPDEFVTDTWRLSASGYANLRDHGASYLDHFNAIADGFGGTILHGTLHQTRGGAALTPPEFDITYDVVPSPRLLTIRRRLPRSGSVSP